MTKKVDGGEVKVKISDGGSLKDLGKKAKKAGKDVGSVAKNVNESDRRLKSLSKQTSNTTKEFSKQAQTIGGGLVPIYATIAAQVFAVSAAFRFLQEAMETRNMIEGQKAFGAITGNAFATVTEAVQAATDGMLNFKDAASAVAIGTAAGLSRSQLEGLGKAAKDASLALGRDLTDSFNRLIRGVTKAEPELLDELGIILRLEPATEKYAQAIGKARTELTAFERSQAVANEVLDQAETKFGRITQIMDPDAFALGQLAKDFDDLMKVLKQGIAEFLIPVVQFLSKNFESLIGVIALLVAPIVTQLMPNFGAAADKMKDVAKQSRSMAKSLKQDAKIIGTLQKGGKLGEKGKDYFAKSGTAGMQSVLAQYDMSEQSKTMQKAARGKKLNQQELGVLKRHLKDKNHLVNTFTNKEKAMFDRYIRHQELSLKGSLGKMGVEYDKLGMKGNAAFKEIQGGYQGMKATVTTGLGKIARLGNFVMKSFGWISLLTIAFQGLKTMFGAGDKELSEVEKRTQELTEELATLNEELERMVMVREEGLLTGGAGFLEQMSNALKTGDLMALIKDFNKEMLEAGGVRGETKDRFLRMAHNIEKLVPGMKMAGKEGQSLTDTFENAIENLDTIDVTKENPFIKMANDIMAAGMALSQFNAQMQELDKQKLAIVTGTKARPFSKMIDAINSATGESGSLGQNALDQEEMALNTSIQFNQSRKAYARQLQAMMTDGQGTDFFSRKQAAGITTTHGFSEKGVGAFNARLMKDLETLSSGGVGLEIINEALGTTFEDSAEAMEHLKKEVAGFDDGMGGLVDVGDRLQIVYDKIFGKLGQTNVDQLNNLISEETDNIRASARAHREKVQKQKEELAIKKFLMKENDLMFKITADEHQLKLDMMDLSVKAGQDEIRRGKLETELRKENLALERARSDLRTSEFILQTTFEKATETQKQNLKDQVDLARQKVELAEKELQITREMLMLPFEKFMDKTDQMRTLVNEGSYTNSFFNRRNAFLQEDSSRNFVQGAGETAAAKIDNVNSFFQSQGMDNMMIDEEEKQRRVNEAKETALQQLNEEFLLREKISAQLKLQNDISTRLTEGLANDMANALVSVAQGTKTMKQAFSEMAISIIADITRMIIKQLILNALMAMVGMVNPGAAAALMQMPGLAGARQGGIMTPGAGDGYRSYRSGGVADGPDSGYQATLHGTEAIVPLGNDREIPVKMLNGGGGNMTANVTVNMNDGGSSVDVQTEGEKAKAFANGISAAVQQEIVKQQRAGGLLSSY